MWHSPRGAAERLALDLAPVTEPLPSSPSLLSRPTRSASARPAVDAASAFSNFRLCAIGCGGGKRWKRITPSPVVFRLGGVDGLGRTGAAGEQLVGPLRPGPGTAHQAPIA